MFVTYLRSSNLEELLPHLETEKEALEIWREKLQQNRVDARKSSISPEEIAALYTYSVPELSPDGSCSIHGKLAAKPYDLRSILPENEQVSQTLQELRVISKFVADELGVDWFGIYLRCSAETDVLVKLAYIGRPSRAEFPLTAEFAKNSNNSTVGLSGKATYFQSIDGYDGPYYECDQSVKSEACLPILSQTGEVIGIIDAESFATGTFTPERLLKLAVVAEELSAVLDQI